eukprot:CAMPEP_0117680022 /NCGR_PEP_ID=MMETSP0804-20121206/18116_1 /TAXON_ID=1074897 /ORGANISM="Tetraselmis astigmatica, Strain CCMP880" /LENGTH=49 /DNA_ID= /DNA_START= /DNA_END= /DNA_ORIENTATION=
MGSVSGGRRFCSGPELHCPPATLSASPAGAFSVGGYANQVYSNPYQQQG